MRIYCFSGLGADDRMFEHLSVKNHEFVHLTLPDLKPHELFDDYCDRLVPLIDIKEPFCFIGISFGGILAMAMAKRVDPSTIFVISGFTSSDEIILPLRLAWHLGLHKLVRFKRFRRSNSLIDYLFGVTTERDRQLLNDTMVNTKPAFARWAIDQVFKWKGSGSSKLVRIHGSRDRLIPLRKQVISHVIPNAGHLSVLTHPKEVSAILDKMRRTGFLDFD